ncbi:membrane hypothetical protein [Cupriavidus necator]|uniref:Uncharacterized protein n=1 Tax=Cupriavidus necator TaxID=106590 RepID=A0A1K0JS77_CUPNE|nr:membrane hypothetical protein [Cupriavidus necator]
MDKSTTYKAFDHDGMYMTVSPAGTVTFRHDYRLNGRRETLTIGRSAIIWAVALYASVIGLSWKGKGLLFFSALLPQFIHAEGAIAAQYVTLALVTAGIDIALMSVYAVGGHHAMRILSGRAMRWLNRGCAGMLAGLGVALSLYRRSDLH